MGSCVGIGKGLFLLTIERLDGSHPIIIQTTKGGYFFLQSRCEISCIQFSFIGDSSVADFQRLNSKAVTKQVVCLSGLDGS